MDDDILFWSALILVAFAPSLLYLVWIRNTEKHSREPYGTLIKVFAYGAVLSVIMAVLFELILIALFDQNIERVYQFLGENPSVPTLVVACVIAPVVEELTKALGVLRVKRRGMLMEIENGIVYGAAAGLGFAATENLLYESTAYLADGVEAWAATAVLRSLSSALLHATASSLVGLGIARSALQGKSWMPYYLGAVVMHGGFNFAASFGVVYYDTLGDSAYLIGLVAAFTMVIIGVGVMRGKIRQLDRRHRRVRTG
ncbi:MAG: PrsW family glutamic-type intramembrane protease [Candidatus Thermoplasmatota archaeon]